MNSNIKITARVSCVQKNLFTIIPFNEETGDYTGNDIDGKLKGKFYQNNLPLPVVGDYVYAFVNNYGDALIDEVLPRKNEFVRIEPSTKKKEILVSNFDYVFIVTSLNQNYNEKRISRFVSVTLESGAKPVLILSKADLCDDLEEKIEITQAIYDKADVIAVSSKTGYGIDRLKPYLKKGNTIAIMGSSGVGKSTLLNTLSQADLMKVSEIRECDGKGRHTTTYRELFRMDNGCYIMDTPGLRELAVGDIESGLDEAFSDVTGLFCQCRFSNCRHETEPGCGVKAALEDGSLSEERWLMYKKLFVENKFNISIARQMARVQHKSRKLYFTVE